MEAGIIEQMIRKSGDDNDNEDEVQAALEKIDLQSLRWKSLELSECDTRW